MSSILLQPRHLIVIVCLGASVLFSPRTIWAASQLSLSWVDNSTDEDGFSVERKTGASGAYTQVTTTTANVTSYLDTDVKDGTTYCYRVQSFNSGGSSAYSNEACGTVTPPPSSPPPATQTFSVTVSIVGQGVVSSSPAGISCAPTCQANMSQGVTTTLTAKADAGWQFSSWKGDCAGQGAACTLTIDQTKNVTANFFHPAGTPAAAALSNLGTFRNGVWLIDNGNYYWEGCTVDTCVTFGSSGDQPVVGYWGTSTQRRIGVFRQGAWYLDNGNLRFDGCSGGDICVSLGGSGDQAVVGDINGDGKTELGVFNNGKWYFDTGNYRWDGCGTDICARGFGLYGDQAVMGDWDGDGRAEIGTFRNGDWFLDNGNRRWDGCGVDKCIRGFGQSGDYPVVGDWNGDGRSKIGVFRRGEWHLDNGNGVWDSCAVDKCVTGIGTAADLPISKGP